NVKVVNGRIYKVTVPSNNVISTFYFNRYDTSGKPFLFAPSYSYAVNANIYRFAATVDNTAESTEVVVGGSTAVGCSADGAALDQACPTSMALYVTPNNDLYWVDGRISGSTDPFRIRTASAGKVQTVAG